jgi:hypothetical protein
LQILKGQVNLKIARIAKHVENKIY